jgi:arsenate reductase (thioredoxin)
MSLALLFAMATLAPSGPKPATPRVVFVCEHGNVKSLIAREWFNRLAASRGLAVLSISRGLRPEAGVPPSIAASLQGDGFDVRSFEARALVAADLDHASQVVLIGAEPPVWLGRTRVPVERWEGIPAASESYRSSRDALRSRIEALLDVLAGRRPAR